MELHHERAALDEVLASRWRWCEQALRRLELNPQPYAPPPNAGRRSAGSRQRRRRQHARRTRG